MLLFTASEIETAGVGMGVSPATAGLLGGMAGGVAQAYATMGRSSHTEAFFIRDAYFYLLRLVHHTVLPSINHLSGLTCMR